ncbi:hypothetical protein KI387_008729, partial [Taxus chinensis]
VITRSQARHEVNFALMSSVVDSTKPDIVREALDQPQWKQDMDAEYDSLIHNQMWELVDLPP